MLKTSVVASVVLMLILPSSTSARTAEKSSSVPEGFSERLPFTRTHDTNDKEPCDGLSVNDFVQGKCHRLKGFDLLRDIKTQFNGSKPGTVFEPFVKESGGSAWHIYGDEGPLSPVPFFTQPRRKSFGLKDEYTKESVEEFLHGKSDRLRGVDSIPANRSKPLPLQWGGDDFVKTEGFTQSGEPYQQVNPLYGIEAPKLENGKFKFENWKLPQD